MSGDAFPAQSPSPGPFLKGKKNESQLRWIGTNVSNGSNASVELSWHVGFTPNSGRMTATRRTDAPGQSRNRPKSTARLLKTQKRT